MAGRDIVAAVTDVLLRTPFGDQAPAVLSSGDMQADVDDVERRLERSTGLLAAVSDLSIAADPGDSGRDLLTATISLMLTARTSGSEWSTALALFDWLRTAVRSDPTLGGAAVDARAAAGAAAPQGNSARTLIEAEVVVVFEAAP